MQPFGGARWPFKGSAAFQEAMRLMSGPHDSQDCRVLLGQWHCLAPPGSLQYLLRLIAMQIWHARVAKAPAKPACGLLGRQLALQSVAV